MLRRDALKFPAAAALGLMATGASGAAHAQAAAAGAPATAFDGIIKYLQEADAVAEKLGRTDMRLRPGYHQHVMMLLALGYVEVFGTSVERPNWVPHIPFYLPWGSPNPDDNYRFVPIEDHGIYRLKGFKGSLPVATITVRNGGAHLGKINGRTLREIDLTTIPTDAAGNFDFMLSATRPADWSGEWFEMPKGTESLLFRSRTAKPGDQDPECIIERLDGPPPASVPSPEQLAHKMAMLAQYASNQNEFLLGYFNKVAARGGDKGFVYDDQSGYGGLVKQKYLMHIFTLEPGEALVLETEVPQTYKYWSVQTDNDFFDAIDYVNRQASLNHEQAKIDKDGKLRIIVSAEDPGVANWLDTGGWNRGGMLWRWNESNIFPLPTVRKVPLAKARSLLPKDTVMVTPKERAAILSARAAYYQTRGR